LLLLLLLFLGGGRIRGEDAADEPDPDARGAGDGGDDHPRDEAAGERRHRPSGSE